MPDLKTGIGIARADSAYPGTTPTPPTPPAVTETALSAGAPALGLNLGSVIFIVAGDIQVTTSLPNAVIQRR